MEAPDTGLVSFLLFLTRFNHFEIKGVGMKKMMTVIAILTSGAASFANADVSALGTWKALDYTGSPLSILGEFTISANSFEISSTCTTEDGSSVKSSVTVPAELSQNSIQILEAKSSSEAVEGYPCVTSVEAGALAYTLNSDGTLTITQPNGTAATFSRQ
jgi:hypothetical protein